jgi:hypothetical protein
MAGALKYSTESTDFFKSADARQARAFCEGRAGLIAGANSNPHDVGDELYLAYEAGYSTVTPEGHYDNCAMAIPITMPNIVGMSSTDAQTSIINAGLAVGTITGTTGVVTDQLPLSNAKTQPNDLVNFTIA